MFYSTKLFNGYSACFRQHKADHSHCKFVHGYALSFKVTFIGTLDERNWVCDFGSFKLNGTNKMLKYFFDHTMIVSEDDPMRVHFEDLENFKLVQLRILPSVGCEKFAEFVYQPITYHLFHDEMTQGRVFVKSVECMEHSKNSAIYVDDTIEHDIKNKNTLTREIRVIDRFTKFLKSCDYNINS